MADRDLQYTQFTLDGELITSVDPVKIGANFSTLTNLRYTDLGIRAVQGMTKVNTATINATYDDITNVFHFKKDDVPIDVEFESHVVTRSENASGAGAVYEIEYNTTTDAPSAKAFTATALHTDETSATEGYFSHAPGGSMAYANGYETRVWGGDHLRIGAFYHYDPSAPKTLYDYTEQVTNTDRNTEELATVKESIDGINVAGTAAALEFDDYTDSSANGLTVTNGAAAAATTITAYGATPPFGSNYVVFGSGDYFTIGDDPVLNFSASKTFTIEAFVFITSLAANNTIYYQQTDGANYFHIFIDTDGYVNVSVFAIGAEKFAGAATFKSKFKGVISKAYHIAVTESTNDWYIHVNGNLVGYTSEAVACADYTGDVYIGENGAGGGDTFVGAMDCLRISTIARYTEDKVDPPAIFFTDDVSSFLIGCTRPSNAFYFDVVTANTTDDGVTYISYWNGTNWATCSSIDDSGITSGVDLLGQSGSVTFTDTSGSAQPHFINDVQLYWYKVEMTKIATTTTISYVTAGTAWQNIVDLWDGEYRDFVRAYGVTKGTTVIYHDYTLPLGKEDWSEVSGTTKDDYAANLDTFAVTQSLVFGFIERTNGLFIVINGNEVNSNATTALVDYWNGTAWTAANVNQDSTAVNAVPLNNTGIVTWEDVDAITGVPTEFEYTFKGVKLYWYRLSYKHTLSTGDIRIDYVAGLPCSNIGYAYNFTTFAQERLWLCRENKTKCSAKNTADVFNGEDSVEFEFGDTRELTAGVEIYNLFESQLTSMILFFKANSIHVVSGNTPEDWIQYTVSTVIGCVAPLTVQVVNAVSGENQDVNRTAVIWQGANGVYKYDGSTIIEISKSISDVFDQTSDNAIETDRIHLSTSFYDINKGEYHWLYTANGSTKHDKEAIYDVRRNKFFYIDRGADNDLQVGTYVEDQVGNVYTYAANYDTTNSYGRHLFRLENDTDFDGTDITHTFQIGGNTLHKESVNFETIIRNIKLFTLATSTDVTITGTHYGDTATTGTDFAMSQSESGYRVAKDSEDGAYGPYTFHSVKMVCATDDETIGFEPYYLGIAYKLVRGN